VPTFDVFTVLQICISLGLRRCGCQPSIASCRLALSLLSPRVCLARPVFWKPSWHQSVGTFVFGQQSLWATQEGRFETPQARKHKCHPPPLTEYHLSLPSSSRYNPRAQQLLEHTKQARPSVEFVGHGNCRAQSCVLIVTQLGSRVQSGWHSRYECEQWPLRLPRCELGKLQPGAEPRNAETPDREEALQESRMVKVPKSAFEAELTWWQGNLCVQYRRERRASYRHSVTQNRSRPS